MGAGSGHRSGIVGQLILTAHQVMKALPEGRDRLVFSRHPEHFFELAIQDVARGQQFLESLDAMILNVLIMKVCVSYGGDLCRESIAFALKERGFFV